MSGTVLRALAVGHVTLDRYGDAVLPGGCALFAAKTWKHLGADAAVATAFGPDFDGEAMLHGLTVFSGGGSRTTVFSNIYPPQAPRRQRVETEARPVHPDPVPAAWRRPDVALLAPVLGEVDLARWMGAIWAPVIGVGLQGFLKGAGKRGFGRSRPVVRLPVEPDLTPLAAARAVFLSDEDILLFSEPSLPERLRRLVPIVVLTRGADGATVYEGQNSFDVRAPQVTVVDPTGAGDTFAAAFLFAIGMGGTPEEAARLATATAAIAVQGRGSESLCNRSLS